MDIEKAEEMTTPERLVLRLEEPGEDPIIDQVFEILCATLQPNCELSLDAAIEATTTLLDQKTTYLREICVFVLACYEVAEQIPYSHPSMTKLVTFLYLCLNSSKLCRSPIDNLEDDENPGQTVGPYQMLGETLRDAWDSSLPPFDTNSEDISAAEYARKFVNFQTFTAQILERGMGKGANLAIWLLRDTFDNAKVMPDQERNAYVKASSLWLLHYGDVIHSEASSKQWKRWHIRMNAVATGNAEVSRRVWKRWYDWISGVAIGKSKKKPCVYDQESVLLAGRAAVAMDSIERKKTG